MALVVPERKLKQIQEIRIARPKQEKLDWTKKATYAEWTGRGDSLCIDGYFGRIFRSDEESVKDEVEEYCQHYRDMCRRADEDPAKMCYEVLNYNDLYAMLGLIPSMAGEDYGYTNIEDYRVTLEFDFEYVTDGDWVKQFGEPIFIFEPKEFCRPDPCYMEV